MFLLVDSFWLDPYLRARPQHLALSFSFSFSFSFSGYSSYNNPSNPTAVTGLVEGLIDNLDNQTSGITITIITATNGPSGGWPQFQTYKEGPGFDISSGNVTGIDILFSGLDQTYLSLGRPWKTQSIHAKIPV